MEATATIFGIWLIGFLIWFFCQYLWIECGPNIGQDKDKVFIKNKGKIPRNDITDGELYYFDQHHGDLF